MIRKRLRYFVLAALMFVTTACTPNHLMESHQAETTTAESLTESESKTETIVLKDEDIGIGRIVIEDDEGEAKEEIQAEITEEKIEIEQRTSDQDGQMAIQQEEMISNNYLMEQHQAETAKGDSLNEPQRKTDTIVAESDAIEIEGIVIEDDEVETKEELQPEVTTEEQVEQHTNDKDRQMHIQVGDTILKVALADNSSVEALREYLADGSVALSLEDYAGMEKVGALGTKLPQNNEQIHTSAGDVILYQGNQFVIYYSSNTWSLTRLGRIEGISPDELKRILGSGSVEITLSLP